MDPNVRDRGFAVTLAPTGRALSAAAAGLAVAVLPAAVSPRLWPLWVLAIAGTVVGLAVDAVLAPRRGELRWDLAVPASLAMGEAGELVLHLSVDGAVAATVPPWEGRRRAARAVLDLDGPVEPVEPRGVTLARGAGAALLGAATFPLVPRRRGTARVERLWLRVPGPLGLIERTVTAEVGRAVEIHPNIARVRRTAVRFADRRTYLSGLKIERYAGDGTEFEALREFVPGHDSRAIDWKATARHRRLLCREFRAERDHQVVVAFDTGRLMAEPLAGGTGGTGGHGGTASAMPRLDHAIHTGLLLVYVALRSGDRVGLYAFDERPRMFASPQAGARRFPSFLRLVAGLDYTDAETNFTLGLTELAGRIHRRSLVVVLTDFVDSVTAELMTENLTRLARRHLVLFVAVRDPLLDELAGARPRSLLDVQRAGVAADLARERERVQARLRRAGVFAVDLAPARVEPRVLQRYLDIKRKEMIA